MRKVLYVLILGTLFFVPLEHVQIAELAPVTAVALLVEDGEVALKTDCGFEGKGPNVEMAIMNLKERADAVVYLDTAKYLFISNDAQSHITEIGAYLKDSVGVCVADTFDDLTASIKYLEVHGNLPELRRWKNVDREVKK